MVLRTNCVKNCRSACHGPSSDVRIALRLGGYTAG